MKFINFLLFNGSILLCLKVIKCQQFQTNSVQEFVGQLTNLVNQGSGLYRPVPGGYGLYTGPSNYQNQKPNFQYPNQPPNFNSQNEYKPSLQGLQQQSVYAPNSFLGALTSIARNDDLRCVPRLLCEVTAGTRLSNGNLNTNQQQQTEQQSILPFFSKDALIALLTVLNFVDNSPLLLLGRAALLGYTAKGDAKSCLNAYPTCPKDPDQLVNYLNNHNGGFFKFFNQHMMMMNQIPEPQKYYKKQKSKKYYNPRNLYEEKLFENQNYYPVVKKFISDRVLNNPVTLLTVEDKFKLINNNKNINYYGNQNLEQNGEYGFSDLKTRRGKKIAFKESNLVPYEDSIVNYHTNSAETEKGKKIIFPDQLEQFSNLNQDIFPDRTGTGNLILDKDNFGSYRIVYATEGDRFEKKSIF